MELRLKSRFAMVSFRSGFAVVSFRSGFAVVSFRSGFAVVSFRSGFAVVSFGFVSQSTVSPLSIAFVTYCMIRPDNFSPRKSGNTFGTFLMSLNNANVK